jgi:hypothetical protein
LCQRVIVGLVLILERPAQPLAGGLEVARDGPRQRLAPDLRA